MLLDLKNCPFCGGDKVSVQHGTTSTRGQYLMVWCVSCQAAGGEHLAEAEAIAAWNRRALQAVGPESVAVKPLEWVDADEGMCTKWRAAALGGHYELVDFGKDDPGFAVNFHWGRPLSFWFIQGEPDERGPTGPKIFPTLKAAKAAAQADYERRIRSALVATPPAAEAREARLSENIHEAWREADAIRELTSDKRIIEKLDRIRAALSDEVTR